MKKSIFTKYLPKITAIFMLFLMAIHAPSSFGLLQIFNNLAENDQEIVVAIHDTSQPCPITQPMLPGLNNLPNTVDENNDGSFVVYRGYDGCIICSFSYQGGRLYQRTSRGYCCTPFKVIGTLITSGVIVRSGGCF